MEYNVPDTLVLKIEENETHKNLIDTTLYILYDTRTERYVIRGKRRSTNTCDSKPYSFEVVSSRDLCDFIECVIDPLNRVSYTLYNYDNLNEHSDDITYEFLEEYDNKEYEIVGYDNRKLNRQELLKQLRILRSVFNYY